RERYGALRIRDGAGHGVGLLRRVGMRRRLTAGRLPVTEVPVERMRAAREHVARRLERVDRDVEVDRLTLLAGLVRRIRAAAGSVERQEEIRSRRLLALAAAAAIAGHADRLRELHAADVVRDRHARRVLRLARVVCMLNGLAVDGAAAIAEVPRVGVAARVE